MRDTQYYSRICCLFKKAQQKLSVAFAKSTIELAHLKFHSFDGKKNTKEINGSISDLIGYFKQLSDQNLNASLS